jgi:hypothetical protein
MEHWIQYHNPDVMEYGIDEVTGPPYSILSDKAIVAPHRAVIWLVGRRAAVDHRIYLAGWYLPNEVRSAHPETGFLYEYPCDTGADCDPMPDIKQRSWYPDLLKLTGNFHRGLTRITRRNVRQGLLDLAAECGAPLEEG